MTLDMLRSAPRPDDAFAQRRSSVPVAWKTGTSWGFRDAWTAGVFGPYVLVVWVGNFDGSGNPAFVGVQAAAPLFFRIVDAIGASRRTRRAGISSAAATGTRRRLQRIGRSAERGVPADCEHLVHPGRFADSREPGASTRVDRHAHGRAGVPAVRSAAHAI